MECVIGSYGVPQWNVYIVGDAIAFSRQSRRTTYIRDLPPEVDDILTPVFKERMTWLIKECLRVEPNLRITYDNFYQVIPILIPTVLYSY